MDFGKEIRAANIPLYRLIRMIKHNNINDTAMIIIILGFGYRSFPIVPMPRSRLSPQ